MAKELEKLMKQKKAIELKISRQKKKVANQDRKDDTRRKILVGAVILEKMKKDSQLDENVNKYLADSLVYDRDRILFELPLLEKSES